MSALKVREKDRHTDRIDFIPSTGDAEVIMTALQVAKWTVIQAVYMTNISTFY